MKNREIRLRFPKGQGERTLACLAILSWYLPDLTRFEVQEYLRRKTREHEQYHLQAYLQTKELMIHCLHMEYDYSRNDLFGNILVPRGTAGQILPASMENKMQIYIFLGTKPEPRSSQRKRGYTDHGSRADISVRARREANTGSYAELLEIELERNRRSLLIQNLILSRQLEMCQGVS